MTKLVIAQVRGIGGGAGGEAAGLGGPLHHSGSGSGSHTPMEIDEGIEIPPEKVRPNRIFWSSSTGAFLKISTSNDFFVSS